MHILALAVALSRLDQCVHVNQNASVRRDCAFASTPFYSLHKTKTKINKLLLTNTHNSQVATPRTQDAQTPQARQTVEKGERRGNNDMRIWRLWGDAYISVQRRPWVSPSTWPARLRRRARKTRNKKTQDEFGDAAVNVPQHQTQVHASTPHPRPTRRVGHRCANRAAKPPRSELQQPNPTWISGYADNIGRGGRHYCGDVKMGAPSSNGEHAVGGRAGVDI